MTTAIVPKAVNQKISLMRQAAAQFDQLSGQTTAVLNSELSAKLRAQADQLEQERDALATLHQALAPLKDAEQKRFSQASLLVRTFVQGHYRRILLEPRGVELKALFDLDRHYLRKVRTKAQPMLELAEKIVAREALALAQGFAPSTHPSAPEIAALLPGWPEALRQLAMLKRQTKEQANRLARINDLSGELLLELLATLRLAFHKQPHPTRRELMRTFGFRFRYSKQSEAEDPQGLRLVEEQAQAS